MFTVKFVEYRIPPGKPGESPKCSENEVIKPILYATHLFQADTVTLSKHKIHGVEEIPASPMPEPPRTFVTRLPIPFGEKAKLPFEIITAELPLGDTVFSYVGAQCSVYVMNDKGITVDQCHTSNR